MTSKAIRMTEAAAYLGITKSYLYRLVHEGRITNYKPMGGIVYFKLEDLDEYLFRGKRLARKEVVK